MLHAQRKENISPAPYSVRPQKRVNKAFMTDSLSWFLRLNGGHVHRWKYGSIIRPDGSTGSTTWHDFVSHHKEYYPIRAESTLMNMLVATLERDFDTVIEFGVGDKKSLSGKTMKILSALPLLRHYYAVDFSRDSLDVAHDYLSKHIPEIALHDVLADFYETPVRPKGRYVLGSFLGATVSNLNMMVDGQFPRAELISNLQKLTSDSKGRDGGALVFSFDSNEDWNQVRRAYTHPDYERVITGIMYDIAVDLKPEGDFDPAVWQHVQIVDEKNYVAHQCVTPSRDQYFKLGDCVFDIKKGCTPLVVVNTFKIPLDVMTDIVDESGLDYALGPIKSKDHSMVMLGIC